MAKISLKKFLEIYEKRNIIKPTGEIFNKKTKKKIKPTKTFPNKKNKNKGYFLVSITYNKKQYRQLLHRLIAYKFIANPNNKPQVNHIDNNGFNNNIDNLEWVSDSENKLHYLMHHNYSPKKDIVYLKKIKKFNFKNEDADFKSKYILEVVNKNDGNMAKAARELNYSRERIRQILYIENDVEVIKLTKKTYVKNKFYQRKCDILKDYHS